MSLGIILATGFMQPDRISNGLAAILRQLESLNLALLELVPWKTEVAALAKRIAAAGLTVVGLVGHSYGVWMLAKLEKALGKLGVKVRALFSCDGVSRSKPRVLVFSGNVAELRSWRQKKSPLIHGSPIALDDPESTVWIAKDGIDAPHRKMDELPGFQADVIQFARSFSTVTR